MSYVRPTIFDAPEWVLVTHASGEGTGVNGDMQALAAVSGADIQYGAAIWGAGGTAFINGYQADPAPHYVDGVLQATPYTRYDDTQNRRTIADTTIVYFNPYVNEWTGERDAQFAVGLTYLIAGVDGAGAWELELFKRIPYDAPPPTIDPSDDPCPRPDWPYQPATLDGGGGPAGVVRLGQTRGPFSHPGRSM